MAVDKANFVAGTAEDSIGVGEYLQILDADSGWKPVLDSDDKPLPASQVVTSMGLLAFKTLNDSGHTVIGYATYGQRVNYSANTAAELTTESSSISKARMDSPAQKESATSKLSQQDEAYLKALLESEKSILEAYKQAFGAAEAKRKVIEGTIQSLKSAGREALIDVYRERSQL